MIGNGCDSTIVITSSNGQDDASIITMLILQELFQIAISRESLPAEMDTGYVIAIFFYIASSNGGNYHFIYGDDGDRNGKYGGGRQQPPII